MTLRVVRETHDHLRARSAKVRDRALLAWRAHAAAQVRAQLATQRVAERAAAEVRGLVAEGRIPASRARVEVERIMRRAEVEIRAQVLAALARSANTARGIAPVVPAGSSAESSPLGGAAMIGNLPRSSPMTREQRREFVRVRGQGEGTEVVAGRFDATTAAAMRNAERASLAYRASSRLRARTDETVARVARTIEDGLRTRDSAIGIVRKVASVDATRITLAGYVEDVVAAIQSGEIEDPRARARLLATVQNAASRLGSAYDGERTIRAAVDRLAGAIEREDVQATADAVEGYIARKYRYEVGRIVRTEGMRAFARASLDRMRSTPGVYAYEWRLSPSHPEPDICDVFARADLHGLGPGCYPVGQGPVAPAHPNCTCVMVPKISPESIRAARRGERMPRGKPADRSWSDWLRKRDRATQEAIVGIGAADLLAAGVDVVTSGGRVRPLWDLLGSGPPMRYAAGRPVDIERGEWSPVLDAPVAADEAPKPTGPEAYGEIGKRAGVRSMVEGAELVIPEYVADEAGIDAALSMIGPKWPSIEYVFDEMVPEGEPPPTVEVAFVDGVPRVVSARFPDGTRIESSMPRNMFRVNVSRISGEFEDYDEKVIVSELRSALWWKLADPDVLFRMLREKASGADPVNGIVMDGPSVPDLSPFTKRASFTAVTGVFDQSILSELVGMEVVGERGGDGGKRRDRTVQILDRDVEAAIVGASRRLVDAWSSVRDFNVEDTDDCDEQLHNVAILRSDPNILAIATKPLRGETMTPEEVATLDAIAPRWRSVIKSAARSIVGEYAVRDNVLDDAVIRIPEAQWKAAPDAGAGGSEIRVGPVIEGAYKRDPGFVNASIRAVRVGVLGAWITLPGFVQAASIANGTSLVEGPVVRSIVVRQAPIRRGPAVYSGETFPVGGMTHNGFAEQRGSAARLVERALARGAVQDVGHVLDGLGTMAKSARGQWVRGWIANSDPSISSVARMLFGASPDEVRRALDSSPRLDGGSPGAVDAFARYVFTQYHATQALLQERGIGRTGTIRLYRGVDSDQASDFVMHAARTKEGDPLTLPQRTLASWTTNYNVASSFGAGGGVLYADVPIENVFAHWAVDRRLRGGKEQEVIVAVPPGAAFRVGVVSADDEKLRALVGRSDSGGALVRERIGNVRVPAGSTAAYLSAFETGLSNAQAVAPLFGRTYDAMFGVDPKMSDEFATSSSQSYSFPTGVMLAASGVRMRSGAFEGAGSDAEDRFKLGFVPNGAIESDAASSALASLDTIVRALGVPKEERGRLALAVHSSIPAERVVDAEGTVAWLATKAQSILANRSDTFKTTFTREEKPNGEIRYTGWMHVQSLDVVARTGAYTAAVFPRRGLSANDASDRYPTGTWIEVEFGAGDMVDHWQYGGALVVRDVSTGSLAMRADTSGMRPRIVMESADPVLPPSVAALNARLRDESIRALLPPAPRDTVAIRAMAEARTEIARTTRLLAEKPTMPHAARAILERNVEKAAAKVASLAEAVRGHEAEVEFEVERGTGYPSPMREGRLRTLPFESRIEVRQPSEIELSKLSRSIDLITRKVSPEGIRVVESIVRGSTYRPSAANAPFAAPLGHADSTQKIRTFRAFTADEMEAMPTVNGIQSGTTIALRPMVLQSFQSWAHKRSIAASLGEQRAALWDRELDPVEADEWRSARIAIHEFVHATSPQSGSPMTYASIGRAVEEVSTEVVARAIIRRLSGGPEDPSADPPEAFQGGRFEDTDAYETLLPADRIEAGVRSPGHKVDASYSQWINPLVEAVTVAIFPEGDGREAARRVERAAVEYRTLSGSDVSSTELIPPEALRMLRRITSRDATVANGDARVERRIHAGTWAFLRGLGLDDARTLRVLELWDERGGTG